MKLQVKVKNTQRITNKLLRIPEAMREPVLKALWSGANAIKNTAQKSMRGPKGGVTRTIYRNGMKIIHTASAPGEPPAIDEGDLVKNIQVEVDRGRIVAAVGTNIEHGAILEEASRSKRRPWLRPAYQKNIGKIKEKVARAVNKVLRRFGRVRT